MNEAAHFGLLNFEIAGTVTLALYCTVLFFIERRSSLSNPMRQLLPILLFVVSIVTMAAVVGSAYFGWEVGGSRAQRLPLLAMWALNNALFLIALACIAIVLSKIVLESLYVVFPQAVRVVSFIVRYGFAAMSGSFLVPMPP